jgi:quercetin dioxygenase-like cupin family protein
MTDIARTIYNPLQRDSVTFLKTGAETGGELTLVEVELAPGGGTPPHYHLACTERFIPLIGELGVQIGFEQRALRPGERALVERGVVHRFFNATTEPIRFYVEIAPGDVRFEQSLRIGYGLARDGQMGAGGAPKNPLVLGLLFELSDTRLVGPIAALTPALRLLASIARRRRLDATLIARYAPHTIQSSTRTGGQ